MTGWTNVIIVAHDAAAAQANAILSPDNAGGVIDPTALLNTPAQVIVSSTDETADIAAGTGVNVVLLRGLDANGDAQEEAIAMHAADGRIGVTTVGTWSAINDMVCAAVGSATHNIGTLWVGTGVLTAGVPAVGIFSMEALHNHGLCGTYTVPRNHEFYIMTAEFGGDGAAAFKGLDFEADVYSVALAKELELFDVHLGDGGSLQISPPFPAIVGGQQLRFRGGTIAQTGSLTVRVAGYLRNLDAPNSWGS
jgi:hypothetical protein